MIQALGSWCKALPLLSRHVACRPPLPATTPTLTRPFSSKRTPQVWRPMLNPAPLRTTRYRPRSSSPDLASFAMSVAMAPPPEIAILGPQMPSQRSCVPTSGFELTGSISSAGAVISTGSNSREAPRTESPPKFATGKNVSPAGKPEKTAFEPGVPLCNKVRVPASQSRTSWRISPGFRCGKPVRTDFPLFHRFTASPSPDGRQMIQALGSWCKALPLLSRHVACRPPLPATTPTLTRPFSSKRTPQVWRPMLNPAPLRTTRYRPRSSSPDLASFAMSVAMAPPPEIAILGPQMPSQRSCVPTSGFKILGSISSTVSTKWPCWAQNRTMPPGDK